MPVGYQDYCINGHTLFDLLTFNMQLKWNGASSYCLNRSFRTAGDWFKVFDSETVLVPYKKGTGLIERLNDARLRYDLKTAADLLGQVKAYTVSLPVHQIERIHF